MGRIAIVAMIVGCGARVEVPVDDGAGTTSDGDVASMSGASGLSMGTSVGTLEVSGPPPDPDSGEDSGAGRGPDLGSDPQPDPSPDPTVVSLCDGDPYQVNPLQFYLYEECMPGLMNFTAVLSPDGTVAYEAYAQFYTVNEFIPSISDDEILDPWTGGTDCTLVRYGSSAHGGSKVVLWEDAGDVTFLLGDAAIAAEEYGTPARVIGYTFIDDTFVPPFGQPHGLLATGDTT